MIGIVVFHILMVLLGLGVVTRAVPGQIINDALSYLHTTIGISTPPPEQARMITLIWIGSTVLIVDGCLVLLVVLTNLLS